MPEEKSKLGNLLEAIKAADDELFKRLKVAPEYQTPNFAQMIRETVHEPPRRADPYGDHSKISASPGPRYRTPVSPERVGPPAPYEYIGGRLEQEMPRTSTSTASWRDRPAPLHHGGFDKPFDFGKQRELELRAMGHTPEPYYRKGFKEYGYTERDPMRRPTDTILANPRNQQAADYALMLLRRAGLRDR